jgi:hypothetical protein
VAPDCGRHLGSDHHDYPYGTVRAGAQPHRTTLIDDSTGEDITRPAFAYAVWAEPVVLEIFLVDE